MSTQGVLSIVWNFTHELRQGMDKVGFGKYVDKYVCLIICVNMSCVFN